MKCFLKLFLKAQIIIAIIILTLFLIFGIAPIYLDYMGILAEKAGEINQIWRTLVVLIGLCWPMFTMITLGIYHINSSIDSPAGRELIDIKVNEIKKGIYRW